MPLHPAPSVESPENPNAATTADNSPLGYVDWDGSEASNERVILRSPLANRDRIIRDQYVRIEDPLGSRTGFLGRIVAGPFFSAGEATRIQSSGLQEQGPAAEVTVSAEIELQGELVDGRTRASKSRPLSQAVVHELTSAEVANLLGFSGDMVLGAISGQED